MPGSRDWRAQLAPAIEAARSGEPLRPWPAFALLVLGTIQASLSQMGLTDSFHLLSVGVASAFLATLPVYVLMLAMHVHLRRTGRRLHVVNVVLASAMLGVLRLLVLLELRNLWAAPIALPMAARLVIGMTQGVSWFAFVSIFYANADNFAIERAAVADAQAQLELQARAQSAMSGVIAQELAENVSTRVSRTVSQGRKLALHALDFDHSEEALRRVAQAIRAGVDEDIRPVSHELWTEVPPIAQLRIDVPTLLEYGCYRRPYPIRSSFIAALAFTVPVVVRMPSPVSSLIMFWVQLLVTASVLLLFDLGIRVHSRRPARDFWLGVFATSCATAAVPVMMLRFGWAVSSVRYWALITSFGVALLVVGLAVVFSLSGTRESVLERARASLSHAEVAQRIQARELAEASHALARHLHSSLQGRLMAIALELERAADERNHEVAAEALRRLDALLATPLIQALERPHVDVEQALCDFVAQWAAITTVTCEVRIDDPDAVTRGDVVLGIAEEAVANAVRHAHATTVHISVHQELRDLVVRVVNDGHGSITGAPGLGSKWLDTVSPANWRLTPLAGDGMELVVRLPGFVAQGSAV